MLEGVCLLCLFHLREKGGHSCLGKHNCEFGVPLLFCFWLEPLQAAHKDQFLHRGKPASMSRRMFCFVLMLPPRHRSSFQAIALARLGIIMGDTAFIPMDKDGCH